MLVCAADLRAALNRSGAGRALLTCDVRVRPGTSNTSGAAPTQAERGRPDPAEAQIDPVSEDRPGTSGAASIRPRLRLRRRAAMNPMMGRAGGRYYVLVGPGRTAVCWLWGPPWATLSAMAQACLQPRRGLAPTPHLSYWPAMPARRPQMPGAADRCHSGSGAGPLVW